jgi:PilZ domain-containing protein
MLNAIELTPRQANRLIEQAIRIRAQIEIAPRILTEGTALRGHFTGREGSMLHVEMEGRNAELTGGRLIGAFCEVQSAIGGQVVLFSSCMLDVIEQSCTTRVTLAVPDMVQVSNRRRFERTNATIASEVRLVHDGQYSQGAGLLANISPDGLGCTFESGEINDQVLVGEPARVSFELAGCDDVFELPVTVCNKSLSKDQSQLTLGMEFQVQPDAAADAQTLQRLRSILGQIFMESIRQEGRS